MSDIKFSIMTPVYKVEDYLDECVQSVLSQSYDNFELILVDDGSPDRCGEMCDAWAAKDSRIRVYHKPNGGLVHTRSYALERASGDYYVFLDSDDYIQANTLETLYTKIKETGCDCVIYGYSKIRSGQIIEHSPVESEIYDQPIVDKRTAYNILLCGGGYNAIWRKCAKRSCFDGRDYSKYNQINYGEDLVRSLEIMENASSFLFIGDILYFYRYNTSSMMRSIVYDSLSPDNQLDLIVDAMLNRSGLYLCEDYDRLRNNRLDDLAIELRRIARHCSSTEAAIQTMQRFRDSDYVNSLLAVGYKAVPSLPGISEPGLLSRFVLRINIFLFRKRCYKAFIRLDRLMRKLMGK